MKTTSGTNNPLSPEVELALEPLQAMVSDGLGNLERELQALRGETGTLLSMRQQLGRLLNDVQQGQTRIAARVRDLELEFSRLQGRVEGPAPKSQRRYGLAAALVLLLGAAGFAGVLLGQQVGPQAATAATTLSATAPQPRAPIDQMASASLHPVGFRPASPKGALPVAAAVGLAPAPASGVVLPAAAGAGQGPADPAITAEANRRQWLAGGVTTGALPQDYCRGTISGDGVGGFKLHDRSECGMDCVLKFNAAGDPALLSRCDYLSDREVSLTCGDSKRGGIWYRICKSDYFSVAGETHLFRVSRRLDRAPTTAAARGL